MKIKFEQHVKINDDCISSLEGWMRWMLQIKDSVVLIINIGIWYNERGEYAVAIKRLTDKLLELAQVWQNHPRSKYIAIVFAETTSQHFHTFNGYYVRMARNMSRPSYCSPLKKEINDWRNDMLWDYISGEWGLSISNYPHILLDVLPMQSLTHDLYDLHLRQGRHDCTHYCYTPMLYQPIYAKLVEISKAFCRINRTSEHAEI